MPKVLNTRPKEQAETLSRLLEEAGCESVEIPLVALQTVAAGLEEAAKLDPNEFTGLFLSSPIGLKAFESACEATDFHRWMAKPVYLVGRQSLPLVESKDAKAAFIPKTASVAGFIAEFPAWWRNEAKEALAGFADAPQPGTPLGPQKWLHPCSEKTRLQPDRFAPLGVEIVNVAVYRPQMPDGSTEALGALTEDPEVVTFCSGSAVDHLFEALPEKARHLADTVPAASLGASTTEALVRHGWKQHIQAKTADAPGLVAAVQDLLHGGSGSANGSGATHGASGLSSPRFARAKSVIPGGVNSPVRAFKSVGSDPVFIASAKGPCLYDADGREYIDFVLSWGPMILGHAHPTVIEAVREASLKGLSFGAATEGETEIAETITRLLPSVEKVRLTCSGTEATMSAVRLARGYTGRNKIIKFRGCYHGHGDSFLVQAGSGAMTFGHPSSPGVTPGAAADTLIAEFNDIASVQKLFTDHPDQIAAIITEPVVGNMGVLIPEPGFLQGLRALCDGNKTLLIIDEVMTGFRLGLQGAQGRYGVKPDLTTLGKVVGGGMPLAAYGGRADIMNHLSPEGPVYQAGTLSGNPLAVAAGLATLREVAQPGFYERLETLAGLWEKDLRAALSQCPVPTQVNRVGSMLTVFFSERPVRDFTSAAACDTQAFGRFFQANLAEGLYLAPSQFEAGFLSVAHDEAVLARVAEATERAVHRMR
jgi:glutamate-1-semialdehyde 2,1-aminomutase